MIQNYALSPDSTILFSRQIVIRIYYDSYDYWIVVLNKVHFEKDWELLGKQLREVLDDYLSFTPFLI